MARVMSIGRAVDDSRGRSVDRADPDRPPARTLDLVRETLLDIPDRPHGPAATAFVEGCLGTVADSAVAAERKSRGRPRAGRLLRSLAKKRNVLITTHLHPDPDALASSAAMLRLLRSKLPAATKVSMSIKGRIGGGINDKFAELSDLDLTPWDDATLGDYDAYVLLDTQPNSTYCPLPKAVVPTAVVDHHRGRPGKLDCPFCDVRTDVGATSSIIFSYYMELNAPISSHLGASLLYAIESDLAGAAGQPGELDNIALSSLTLIADTARLYQMRYVDLPQSYYVSYAAALTNATVYRPAVVSHLGTIDSLEKPAVMADFLLRYDEVTWSLVTAVHEDRLVMSLRTQSTTTSAVDVIRKLTRGLGEGGGHRLKAGGYVPLTTGSPEEVAAIRGTLRDRLLRTLHVKAREGLPLVPDR